MNNSQIHGSKRGAIRTVDTVRKRAAVTAETPERISEQAVVHSKGERCNFLGLLDCGERKWP